MKINTSLIFAQTFTRFVLILFTFSWFGISNLVLNASASPLATSGLTIHLVEIGVGKFHRQDNKTHPYGPFHDWKNYILPDSIQTVDQTPLKVKNTDGSYSVFISNLDEALRSMIEISESEQKEIRLINLNGHSGPGKVGLPMDQETMNSELCSHWKEAANSTDDSKNYDQYYSATPKEIIFKITEKSNDLSSYSKPSCSVGVNEWKKMVEKNYLIKNLLSKNAQIHILSCLVGLGKRGEYFANHLAEILFTTEKQRIFTATKSGLGDWSIKKGMRFHSYLNDQEYDAFTKKYPVIKKDRPFSQKGDIRVSHLHQGEGVSDFIENVNAMKIKYDHRKSCDGHSSASCF